MDIKRQFQLCWRCLPYFACHRARIIALVTLTALGTCLGLVQVWPFATLVDSVLAQAPQDSFPSHLLRQVTTDPLAQIVTLAVAAVVLRLLGEFLGLALSVLRVRVAQDAVLRFRCDLFRKLQSMSLSYHKARPQSDVLYRLNEDTLALHGLLSVLLDTSVAVLTLSVILTVMIQSSVQLTLLSLCVAPVLIGVNLWYAERLGSRCRTAKDLDSRLLFEIQRSMTAIPLIQVFCREWSELGRFQHSASVRDRAWEEFHRQSAVYRMCIGLVFGCGTALLLGYGGYLVWHDQSFQPKADGMTVGTLMVFVAYLAMFYDPLCKLSGASASLQSSFAGMERVLEVLDQEPLIRDVPGARNLPVQPRTLTLDHVHFAYGEQEVLRDVTLSIAAGEMVAFVGPSGAGKSTLLNLLPRFLDPGAGQVLLDGHDVRLLALSDLRRHIAVVLQDGLILPATIAENIAYSLPTATPMQIREAAIAAGAHEFIESLPDGYETVLSEGGSNVSGGQRQRIAIARALLSQAPILLLDEPTSALDSESERLLTETLNQLKGKRTIIVVSHRLSTVIHCDRIFALRHGRIVQSGSHDQLVQERGLYADLWRHQVQMEHATPPMAA